MHACWLGYDVCSTAHIRLKSFANDSRTADLRFPLSKNPVNIWDVHESTLLSRNRTKNLRESWKNGLYQIVGHYHRSVWTLIEALRQDSAVAETDMAQNQCGHPPPKETCKALDHYRELNKLTNILCVELLCIFY